MVAYRFYTHPHLGDNVILTGAVHNLKMARPDLQFALPDSSYLEVYENNTDFTKDPVFTRDIGKLVYGNLEAEKAALHGNVVEGFTLCLCSMLNIQPVPIITRKPVLILSEEEKEYSRQFADALVLNANCQTCTISKGYPHWQKVVDALKQDYRIIQVGGNCPKDLSLDLEGVEDWRGKTNIRQLIAMIYGSRGVVSAPSSFTNIAGAFDKPQIVLNAGREADRLTDYENAMHISHKAQCGWGIENGCVSLRTTGKRTCTDVILKDGRTWCKCQWETRPETIIEAVKNRI